MPTKRLSLASEHPPWDRRLQSAGHRPWRRLVCPHFKQRDNVICGLVSTSTPLNQDPLEPCSFTKLSPSTVVRLSGQPKDDDVTVQSSLRDWTERNEVPIKRSATSLSAQSFQCWEWELENEDSANRTSLLHRFAEFIFEMRIIVLIPLGMTILSLAMLGTGNTWLLAAGMFSFIFLSGACKFVFLHQREDATQESHLQNY